MGNLIITITSILLVAVTAIMAILYLPQLIDTYTIVSTANTLYNQQQQIISAYISYKANTLQDPANINTLINNNYLDLGVKTPVNTGWYTTAGPVSNSTPWTFQSASGSYRARNSISTFLNDPTGGGWLQLSPPMPSNAKKILSLCNYYNATLLGGGRQYARPRSVSTPPLIPMFPSQTRLTQGSVPGMWIILALIKISIAA